MQLQVQFIKIKLTLFATAVTLHWHISGCWLLHGSIYTLTWFSLKLNPVPWIVSVIGSPAVNSLSCSKLLKEGSGKRVKEMFWRTRRDVTPSISRPMRSCLEPVSLNSMSVRRGATQNILSSPSKKQGWKKEEGEYLRMTKWHTEVPQTQNML